MRAIPPNRYDPSGENAYRGGRAERLLADLLIQRRYTVRWATPWEDIHEHWDFYLVQKGVRIDVKAMKKIGRGDPGPQDRWHWIELHGVRPRDPGWLYGGRADWIAFETAKAFLIVPRVEIIPLIKARVDWKRTVTDPRQAFYALYARKGRWDLLTLVETRLLEEVALYRVSKPPSGSNGGIFAGSRSSR
ncbi:MAG: hypothetical protein GXO38_03200 [Epsilonproteobacteria bacterium]|nr:hypothetical protein [Campylobacterota bacterium]